MLTLFFIDTVSRYRQYDQDGHAVKGEYAVMFEEEYRLFANHPDYLTLFQEVDLAAAAEEVHDGYFSIDKKKGSWTNTADNNQANRDNAERAYNLVMREKEKLLSLDTPLKFIFSHSALREGWDNPNVFQICALRDIHTERERRQTIGRGLRLCVDQEGQRRHGFDADRVVVRVTVQGHIPSAYVPVRRSLDSPRTEYPVGVAIYQKRQHHPRVVLRRPHTALIHHERRHRHSNHRFHDEMRQIVVRNPFPHVYRQQMQLRLITIYELRH